MKTADTWSARVWIAGSYADAVRACRGFCAEGLCVTVTPATYVYTGGVEEGVVVGLINYPRFPKPANVLADQARRLGEHLKRELFQQSYTIEFSDVTEWYTTRPQDA